MNHNLNNRTLFDIEETERNKLRHVEGLWQLIAMRERTFYVHKVAQKNRTVTEINNERMTFRNGCKAVPLRIYMRLARTWSTLHTTLWKRTKIGF